MLARDDCAEKTVQQAATILRILGSTRSNRKHILAQLISAAKLLAQQTNDRLTALTAMLRAAQADSSVVPVLAAAHDLKLLRVLRTLFSIACADTFPLGRHDMVSRACACARLCVSGRSAPYRSSPQDLMPTAVRPLSCRRRGSAQVIPATLWEAESPCDVVDAPTIIADLALDDLWDTLSACLTEVANACATKALQRRGRADACGRVRTRADACVGVRMSADECVCASYNAGAQ